MLAASIATVATMLTTPVVTPTAVVWNDTGHELIALIAYHELPRDNRARAVAILRKHPRFRADFEWHMPSMVRDLSKSQQDKWIFAHAATWPDIARGFPEDVKREYHHGTWHYVNGPLYLSPADRDHFAVVPPVSVGEEWYEGMRADEMNVVQALTKCTHWLDRSDVPESTKAVYLCWLLHLVGDIHQPLHTTSLFSKERFPKGDLGGNAIRIGADSNLHAHWDGMLGSVRSFVTLSNEARRFLSDTEALAQIRNESSGLDFVEWRDESFELSQEQGYTEPVLSAVRQADRNGWQYVRIRLSQEYDARAGAIARRRALMAGLRLARTIERLENL